MKIKELTVKAIRKVQKGVMLFLLFFLYFFGVGTTRIFVSLFNRRLLARGYGSADTFWVEAEGYEPDMDDAERQT